MNTCPCMRYGPKVLVLAGVVGLGWFGLARLSGPEAASDKPVKAPKARAEGKTGDAWPMFGGTPERNMVNTTAKNLVSSWKVEAPAKNIKWVAKLGDRAYGGPAIAGGQVYMGTNNRAPRDPKVKGPKAVLMCFEEKTGKFLWQLAHDMPPADVHHGEALNEGLCSTPCVDGDRLYYVTPGSELVCASTKGKVVWKYDMMKKLKVFPCLLANCSPLVAEGLVFVMTGNGHDGHSDTLPEPNAPSFAAFTKDGELKWKSNAPGKNIMKGQWSNPAYGKVNGKGQVVFPGGDGWLYAFEPTTGKLLWKFDCNPKGAVFKAGGGKVTANFIVATPVIHDGRVYVGTGLEPDNPAGSGPGHFWCVKMDNKGGDVSHEVVVDAKAKPPKTKVNSKSALAWHFGGPIVPVPKEGREVHMGRTISTCAVKDGLVYLAEHEGYLHCLDAKTGAKYWEHDFKSAVWGCPAWIDGKIYIGDEDSDVFIFAAGKKKKHLGDPIEMGEGIPSTLVAANGTLYIATKSRLFAIGKK